MVCSACSGVIGDPEGDFDDPSRPGLSPHEPLAPVACEVLPARVYPLSPTQFDHTVRVLLPSFEGRPSAPFAHTITRTEHQLGDPADRLQLAQVTVEGLLEATRAIAAHALGVRTVVPQCMIDGPDETCVDVFLSDWLARVFRRPVMDEEVARYAAYHDAQRTEWGAGDAAMQVITASLMDPDFLFRTELGDDGNELTAWERASLLSYFIADSPPDEELTRAAAADELRTTEQIEAQARRLMETPQSSRGLLRLLRELFDYERVVDQDKDPELFPEWSHELAEDLREESDRFLEHVVFDDDARLETLLTADYSLLNARLAEHYGVAAPDVPDGEFGRVRFPEGERAGVLTHGSVMALLAKESQTMIVQRGKFVRERIMCQTLPPAPANAPSIPPRDESASGRQQLEDLTASAECQRCHSSMNPLGFPFESFDPIGRYRTDDLGHVVDPRGAITGTESSDREVDDVAQLVGALADTPEVQDCFTRRVRQYAIGRHTTSCGVRERFIESEGDLRELVIDMVTDESFFVRAREEGGER